MVCELDGMIYESSDMSGVPQRPNEVPHQLIGVPQLPGWSIEQSKDWAARVPYFFWIFLLTYWLLLASYWFL